MAGRQPGLLGGKRTPGQNCFLGLEWALDGLRAVVVDEALDVVGAEEVRFESELPEYGTRGGALVQHTTYALNVPVEMYIKALDLILHKLTQSSLPQRIRAICGAAPSLLLPTLAPASSATIALPPASQPLHTTLSALLAHPLTPLPHPLTSPAHIPALLASLLPSLPAQTANITTLPSFLASLLCGAHCPPSESELAASGGRIWSAERREWDVDGLGEMLKAGMSAGGRPEDIGDAPVRVRDMLPRPRDGEEVMRVAPYFVTRYGFGSETQVHSFLPPHLSFFLSLAPAPQTSLLCLGTPDVLLAPLSSLPPPLPIPTSGLPPRPSLVWEREDVSVVPHPAGPSEGWIAVVVSSYGEESRHQAMGKYCKTWTAFDRLVAVVPPGGTIGLDNKLFCFWGPQGQFRFRCGRVGDFEDARVIPRCLLESQMLHLRVRLSRLLVPPPTPLFPASIPFDPYDPAALPRRMIITGTTAHFPAMAQLVGDIFHATVLHPTPAPVPAYPFPSPLTAEEGGSKPESSRPALGTAYLARHVWRRGGGGGGGFGEEVRALVRRKHTAGPERSDREGLVAKGVLKKSASGGFYAHSGSRLSTTMLVEPVEELDETEADDAEADEHGRRPEARERTMTGSSSTNSLASFASSAPSTLTHTSSTSSLTTLGTPGLSSTAAHFSAPIEQQQQQQPQTPVLGGVGLQTDEADAALGLRKLAEGDIDAFIGYASILPEFLRLERMLSLGAAV